MPRGDGTGPLGLGPRTGRGLGYCSGYSTPGYITGAGFGGGLGLGRRRGGGFGLGLRNRAPYYPPAVAYPPVQATSSTLQSQLNSLQQALADVQRRLDELSK